MARSVYVVGPAAAASEAVGEAVGSLFMALRDASNRARAIQEHKALLDGLNDKIVRAHGKETANHVLAKFEAANYSPDFEFVKEIQWFQRKQMYDFAINVVSENFADALVSRMKKFADVEYEASMNELLERSLTEINYDGDVAQEAERLAVYFPEYLAEKKKRRQDCHEAATLVQEHKIGRNVVSEYSDGRFEFKTLMGEIKIFESLHEARGYLT